MQFGLAIQTKIQHVYGSSNYNRTTIIIGSKEKNGQITVDPVLMQTYLELDTKLMCKKGLILNTEEYFGIPSWE